MLRGNVSDPLEIGPDLTMDQGRPSRGGNEAEIFIIAILGEGNNSLVILGEEILYMKDWATSFLGGNVHI